MRVLIIEDDVILALDLKRMLGRLGHEVAALATTLDEGLMRIEKGGFDIAVIDLNLRGQSGTELPRLLFKKGLPAIITTGYDAKNLPEDLGVCPCLGKPYNIKDLEAVLNAI